MKSCIFLPRIITVIVIIFLITSIIVAHTHPIQNPLPEESRIFWRTIFYILTILILPLTKLVRHISFRLNQTMPLLENDKAINVAKNRYALTVSLSMFSMLLIGSFGSVIFYFGDSFNTLHILTIVAGLGVFLHRPKIQEYQQIQDALTNNLDDDE